MNKYFRIALAIVISALLGLAIGWADNRLVYDWDLDGTNEFAIDDSGNVSNSGTLTSTGAISSSAGVSGTTGTFTDAVTITGALTVTGDTTVANITFGGIKTTIPTSGYNKSTIIYYTGSESSWTADRLYYSTATVNSASSWIAF